MGLLWQPGYHDGWAGVPWGAEASSNPGREMVCGVDNHLVHTCCVTLAVLLSLPGLQLDHLMKQRM